MKAGVLIGDLLPRLRQAWYFSRDLKDGRGVAGVGRKRALQRAPMEKV